MNEPTPFPMSTVRRVRDGRFLLLWLDAARWTEVAAKDRKKWVRVGDAVVAYWCSNEREWMICADESDLHSGSGYNAIDDDFIGWANLPPVDGQP